MSDSRPLRVRVGVNLWLRWALDPVFRGRYPDVIARRLGVGQGPMEFMSRLLAQRGEGIRFVPSLRHADVGLFVGVPAEEELEAAERHGVRIVLRLDGIGLDSPRMQEDAASLRALRERSRIALQRAHGVIFQSEFARRAFCGVFGPLHCDFTVIPNGFLPITGRAGSARSGARSSERTLLVAGRNAPRKRIRQTVARFCRSPFTDDYRLEVAGPVDRDVRLRHPSVALLGKLHPADLQRRLMTTRGLLHLDWYDWCPNLVGEAIMAGAPVLCGRVGGTPELVGSSGLVRDLGDPEPDFLAGPGEVPDIPQGRFDAALGAFLRDVSRSPCPPRPDLYIGHVAAVYRDFICRVAEPPR